MDLPTLFKCLSDPTRLRILNLLKDGPLCVCHIQQSLKEPQVKVSKHLGYMKERGLLHSTRKANWNYYQINWDANSLVEANIKGIANALESNDAQSAGERLNEACCT